MPTGNLPSSGKALWEKVYKAELHGACNGDEECAAKRAWGAVKNAGWRKVGDQWVKKPELEEFSLVITKASLNKSTGKMRWFAVASDVDEDSRKDNMTMELFQDFVQHIENNDLAPEEFQSDYWKGGMPYVSVSHYKDFNGKGIPGLPEDVYIDGEMLKSRGEYFDTPLGRACFKAVLADLYNEESKTRPDKIRISIAFLDWKHRHKGNDHIFERKSLDDICMDCIVERLTGESQGKEFLRGQLVHLALTRVPANPRTSMEVEQSMTTRKDDAASIIGDELAEMLDSEDQTVVGKSEALVIRAEGEEEVIVEEATPPNKHAEDTEYPDCMDEKTNEVDQDCVKRHKQMEKKSEAVEEEIVVEESSTKPDYDKIWEAIVEIKSLVAAKPVEPQPVVVIAHPLDEMILKLKASYDDAVSAEGTAEDKLRALQPSYEQLGVFIQDSIKDVKHEPTADETDMAKFQKILEPLTQQMSMIAAQVQQLSQRPQAEVQQAMIIPKQRSIQTLDRIIPQLSNAGSSNRSVDGKTPNLRKLIEQTTY